MRIVVSELVKLPHLLVKAGDAAMEVVDAVVGGERESAPVEIKLGAADAIRASPDRASQVERRRLVAPEEKRKSR